MRSMAARAGAVSVFVLGASCNGGRPSDASRPGRALRHPRGATRGGSRDAGFDAVVDASSARPVDGGASPRPADAGTADARRVDGGRATTDPDPIAPGYPGRALWRARAGPSAARALVRQHHDDRSPPLGVRLRAARWRRRPTCAGPGLFAGRLAADGRRAWRDAPRLAARVLVRRGARDGIDYR